MTGDGDLATLLVTFGVVFVGVLSVAYLFGTKPAKAPVKKAKRREKARSNERWKGNGGKPMKSYRKLIGSPSDNQKQ